MREITLAEFAEATKEGFTIVDVYGNHCGPCAVLGKTLEVIDRDYPFVTILKLNSDKNKEFCKENNIYGVPTLLFMVDGEIKQMEVGALPESKIMEIASQYMY